MNCDAGHYAWPDWLEANRIDDSEITRAYDSAPDDFRAAIKTGIAYAFFHFGPGAATRTTACANPSLGFASTAHSQPADWAALIFDETAGCALLTAAAMLPVLAHVPAIAAIQIGAPSRAFLLAMTLCGVEDMFSATPAEAAHLAKTLLAETCGQGRILAAGIHKETWLQSGHAIASSRLLARSGPGKAWVMPEALGRLEIIEFCLGSKPCLEEPVEIPDIIYAGPPNQQALPANGRLILFQGCEGVWLFPDMDPDSFRITRHSARIELPAQAR